MVRLTTRPITPRWRGLPTALLLITGLILGVGGVMGAPGAAPHPPPATYLDGGASALFSDSFSKWVQSAPQIPTEAPLSPVPVPARRRPWWLEIDLVMTLYLTVYSAVYRVTRPLPRHLVIAAGVLTVAAEMHGLPGGHSGALVLLAIALPTWTGMPWLALRAPSASWRQAGAQALWAIPLLALIAAFLLQWGRGWQPCLDCWLERGFLVALILIRWLPAYWRRAMAAVCILGGYGVSTVQWLEMEKIPAVSRIAEACTAATPVSCAVAARHSLAGMPIIYAILGIFGGLWGIWCFCYATAAEPIPPLPSSPTP